MAKGLRHDILVVQMAPGLPEKVRETLHARGFGTRVIERIADAEAHLKKLANPILAVHIGGTERAFPISVKALVQYAALQRYPVIIMCQGKFPRDLEEAIEKNFSVSYVVQNCKNAKEIVDALTYVRENYSTGQQAESSPEKSSGNQPRSVLPAQHGSGRQPVIAAPAEPPITPSTAVNIVVGRARPDTLPQSVPGKIFAELFKLSLVGKEVGGGDYAALKRSSLPAPGPYLPTNSAVRSFVDKRLADQSAGYAATSHRTAYLSHCVSAPLNLATDISEALRGAAFVVGETAARQNAWPLLRALCGDEEPATRREITAQLRDALPEVRGECRDPLVSECLSGVMNLIEGSLGHQDQEALYVASTLLMSQLIERTCRPRGPWEPRAAYHLMRRLKQGEMTSLHPTVLSVGVKLVSEAITAVAPAILVRSSVRSDEKLQAAARNNREAVPQGREVKLPLARLVPGMRVARSLRAFDGALVLDPDVELDDDLIWRIWQLCALRPLNQPLFVHAE